jgi:hypothetical protein
MKELENELLKKYNKICSFVSWLTFLQGCYEVASERKQYERAHMIQQLISEDINYTPCQIQI